VLDLYSGAGNFSLPFALSGRTVTAVEADKRLVSFGRQNAQRYRLERTLSFVESSVERYLKEAPQAVAAADLVVADPPRSGLGAVAGALTPCRQIALISCHLPSFVRDLRALTTAGFSPLFIQPFDMFAQTSYVEILCALRRE
jgi:23S rRNA (uracil1939-C5)-methyltransferase